MKNDTIAYEKKFSKNNHLKAGFHYIQKQILYTKKGKTFNKK